MCTLLNKVMGTVFDSCYTYDFITFYIFHDIKWLLLVCFSNYNALHSWNVYHMRSTIQNLVYTLHLKNIYVRFGRPHHSVQ